MKPFSEKWKSEIEKIEIPNEKLDMAIEQAMNKGKRQKWSWTKKIKYISSSIAILVVLLLGSAFFSPTVASVLAKVPFLTHVFQTEPVGETLYDILIEKGYKVIGIENRVKGKTITIVLGGSNAYVDKVKDTVKEKAEKILSKKGDDAHTVKVIGGMIKEESVDDIEDPTAKVLDEISDKFKEEDLEYVEIGSNNNKFERFIVLDIPDTYSADKIKRMKDIVNKAVKNQGLEEFPIKIYKIDMEINAEEKRWYPVIETIQEGLLAKKEFHVINTAYSFHPLPLVLEFRTSVSVKEAKESGLGEKIEHMIKQFIQSDDVKDKVKNDDYVIKVLSKGGKQIN